MAISASQEQDLQLKAQLYDQLKADFDESLIHLKKVIDLLANYPVDDSINSDFVKAQMFHFANTTHAKPVVTYANSDEDLPF